ncbi:MAG TPA: PSD1 and planctomycete cytochrome C domain-containing protein [Prosthecobacter sp.]|nr:PSD1 and planctomycete cytochrome C domain-containing protein [Prosthecobacter sp.]HRK13212.1 PSD1 and planctomycete cytochrome C domain-containing protein [Prosthecobacter sp.]
MFSRPTAILFCLSTALHAAPGELRYNRDIRPILSDNCFACHGPDKNHREADLRLDVREAALEMKAIVPGDPAASSIMDRVHTTDEDDLMPPPESKKTLTDAQKKMLAQWIEQGAPYEPHWAYTPLVKPEFPSFRNPQSAIRNPTDTFIQSRLAEKGHAPSLMAGARTLARRISLDLTGLPPAPQEVERFEKDFAQSPDDAVNALVTRLFKSPHFGERWAVWWLDVARYADTVGFHGDQNQRVFPYRDYVIRSFNVNKRFNQFTLEQLAGDLLPRPTTEQLVATGFNRLNMMTREGGAQPKEYLAKYQADRVRTVGGAWLGATLGCAECHDHKFDPFTMRDFYSLSAYFADIKQFGVYASYGYTPVEELKGWSNDHPFPPEIEVDSPYLKQRLQRTRARMIETAAQAWKDAVKTDSGRASIQSWIEQARAHLQAHPEGWLTPAHEAATRPAKEDKKAPPVQAAVQPDGSVLLETRAPQNTVITLKPGAARIAAIRLELLPHEFHRGIEMGAATNGLTLNPAFTIRQPGADKETPLAILHADAPEKQPRYSGTEEVIGIRGGWKTSVAFARAAQHSVWILDQAVELAEGGALILRLNNHSAGCLRVSISPVAPFLPLEKNWAAALPPLLDKALTSLEKTVHPRIATLWLMQSSQAPASARETWRALYHEALACRDGKAMTQVTVALAEPMPVRDLPRGNWMDESGALRPPAPPEFLTGPLKPDAPRQTRLDLARWLTSAENPLTARTFVNRLWKQFFGHGLSSAVDDLGAQGETPSHPELLDWLASEFRDSGWDIQHVMRLIVTSHTYLQDSRARPELREADPDNRLLAFQNPRRLDAEFVRDNALFAAGILNLDLGGPSAKPYQPPGYYDNLQFPSRDYIPHTDDRQWRRGLYMHWQRTFLHPMLANFDAPARDECTAARTVSNTPQQALTLLNDTTFVEAARAFAQSLPAASDEARLGHIYQRALARPPTDKEQRSLLAFLATQRAAFQAAPQDAQKLLATGLRPLPEKAGPAELAAWTSLCRVVLNLHETLTRY